MTMNWVNTVKVLYQNAAHTVGIVRVLPDGEIKVRKLAGYWNKKLLQDAMDVLDLFEYKDFEVCVIEDETNNASILLLKSPKSANENIYIAVAGKSEVSS